MIQGEMEGAYREELRFRLTKKIEKMIKEKFPLEEIALALGAKDFLKSVGRGRRAGLSFNLVEFIDDVVQRGAFFKLPDIVLKIDGTFVPPDEGEVAEGDNNGIDEKEPIPRTQYLIEVLSEIDQEYVWLTGENSLGMVRERSYHVFIVPKLDKLILVCNEEGNSTFIYHNDSGVIEKERAGSLGEMEDQELLDFAKNFATSRSKKQLKKMKGVVSVLEYRYGVDGWKDRIREFLTTPADRIEFPGYKEQGAGNIEDYNPEGKTVGALAKTLKVDPGTITKQIDQIKKEGGLNEGHIRFAIDPKAHQKRKYLLPELVDEITRRIQDMQTIPGGWMDTGDLDKDLEMTRQTIVQWIKKLRRRYPEEVKTVLAGGRKWVFSPRIASLIREKEEDSKDRDIPDGWKSRGKLRIWFSDKDNKRDKINEALEELKREYPDEFKDCRTGTGGGLGRGGVAEFFSPKIVDMVKKRIKSK